ncbi:MAG: tRNA pseudouridine(38-40) synthase TruA [Candidatus Altiarchaeota archaeon]|nr:tRNA pseudouridine(38-40) synthase TruA [Candidatus Altiarchaeota archaeon]
MNLLKTAYLGWHFHGSQIQPDKLTVESEILQALTELGWLDTRHGFASRTDAGVSALGNVYAYTGKLGNIGLLNSKLNHVRVWGFAQAEPDFKHRQASSRWYRYFLVGDYDAAKLNQLKRFEGRHDFTKFTKSKQDAVKTIDSIRITNHEFGHTIDFRAQSFLWNQIRRMIGTLKGQTAPPEPLVLMELSYKNEPNWTMDRKQLRKLSKNWENELAMSMVKNNLSNIVNQAPET